MFYLENKKIIKNTTLKFHDFWPFAIQALNTIFFNKKTNCGLQTIKVALGKGFQWQTATFCHWIPFPMATLAIGNLCRRKPFPTVKVAIGHVFRWKPWPTATFCRRKRFPAAKVANGQGCHQKRYPAAKGCRLPLEAFSEGNLVGLESMVCSFWKTCCIDGYYGKRVKHHGISM